MVPQKTRPPADPFCSVLEYGVHKVSVNVGGRCPRASVTCLLIETIRDLGSGSGQSTEDIKQCECE